jgi:putative phosphonate metabolism protein
MRPRYAIYFTPAHGSPWWQFGAYWLGRDELTDTPLPQPAVADIPAPELQHITAYPRRYGFHATLKAPFTLRDGLSTAALKKRMRELASTLGAVDLSPMDAAQMGDFVALVPRVTPLGLSAVEAACVTKLEDMRAPLTPHDLARRLSPDLDARAHALLTQYGYPHVLERYRLHLTLSSSINAALAATVIGAVKDRIDQLNATAPLVLDRLCLFEEPGPGQTFRRLLDVELPR